jgi:hypothetical protein
MRRFIIAAALGLGLLSAGGVAAPVSAAPGVREGVTLVHGFHDHRHPPRFVRPHHAPPRPHWHRHVDRHDFRGHRGPAPRPYYGWR